MTETGQVPGEGVPENAGGQQETPQFAVPHAPAGPGLPEESGDMSSPGAYAFHESAQSGTEEDDLLLMPGAQGAWSEHPQPQHQMYAQGQPPAVPPQPSAHEQAHQHAPVQHAAEVDAHRVGTHETGGRDTGSVDYSATRTAAQTDPQPTATQAASPASAAPTRRPLHLGPPVPESSSGVVRFLADRGPAATPTVASASAVSAAEQPGLYIAGPGYPHVQPREEAMGVPGGAAAAGGRACHAAPSGGRFSGRLCGNDCWRGG
jgi:nicotinate-nucleotide--dimethylbenzimidazole phosphoribosyltransferase